MNESVQTFDLSDSMVEETGVEDAYCKVYPIDGYGSQGSQVIKGKAQNFSDLPTRATNGLVVEITGDAGNIHDNYYVKFETNSNSDSGVWVECIKPGLDNNYNTATMPHLLIRTADGNFRYTPADGSTYTISGVTYTVPKWNGRVAGDEFSSPMPTMIGKTISDIFFLIEEGSISSTSHLVFPAFFASFSIASIIGVNFS